jgi:isopentenyl phosphate kinase
MKKIVFVKLGGNLITDKSVPFKIRENVIKDLASQIKKIVNKHQDLDFIFGNGAGSFGHYYASKYKNINEKELKKFAFIQIHQSVVDLNKIIVDALLKEKVNVFSLSPASIITVKNNKVKFFLESLLTALNLGIYPVVYGDVILDDKNIYQIFSTEKIFFELIKLLLKLNFQIEKIIYLTNVPGVLDDKNSLIPLINKDNFNKIKKYFFKKNKIDTSGEMYHKVFESLKLAKFGIKTLIIDGFKKDNLEKAIVEDNFVGTVVE